MCGIAGYIDYNKRSDKSVLSRMADALLHRGPDDSGYETFEHPQAQIGFGFRRLSIIDLSQQGHQPMQNDDGSLAIIFNGEIYNYLELRKELEKYGFRFKSNSDTEVILKSYQKWGKECVHRFIGMFVIAIYDRSNEKLVLFRDRAGVKPLFYYWKNDTLLFASELKSFHEHPAFEKEIDFNALSFFFQHLYIPAPYCVFNNSHKLLPGHWLEFDIKKKDFAFHCYWNVIDVYNKPRINVPFEEAMAETEKLLISACQYRMIADVPVGVFLSGGYDSSAVAALLQKNMTKKLKTFTIGFHEDGYNEAVHARKVALYLGTEHYEHYCTFKEAIEIIPELPYHYDEPFADHSAIPTILVSRIARQHVKVALSADGGDETFGGYIYTYKKVMRYISLLNSSIAVLNKLSGKVMQLLAPLFAPDIAFYDRYDKLQSILQTNESVKAFDIIRKAMTDNEVQRIFFVPIQHKHSPFDDDRLFNANNDVLSKALATDYRNYMMDDILQKVDRATMSVSLEGREPLIDHRIIEYIATLPMSYKIRNGEGKYILKQIVHKYIPKEIMHRPKMGFGVPVSLWCKKELKDTVLQYMNEDRIRKDGIFKPEMIGNMLKQYFCNRPVAFERIWCVLMFQMWKEKWMK